MNPSQVAPLRAVLLVGAVLCATGLSLVSSSSMATESARRPRKAESVMPTPSEPAMRRVLAFGRWSPNAEDNLRDEEVVDAEFLRGLVLDHARKPMDMQAAANLSLITLTVGVAQWGVSPVTGLPADPAGKGWRSGAGTNAGKHVMNYAIGGIGIAHVDSDSLVRLFEYLEKYRPDVVPQAYRAQFFALKGTRFEILFTRGGHCTSPVSEIEVDLDDKPFGHAKHGTSGKKHCDRYTSRGRTTLEDWRVFRHGMREALRHEDVQLYVIRDWTRRVWWPSYLRSRSPQEAMVNARLRNSAHGIADCALRQAAQAQNAAEAVAIQIDSYSGRGCSDKDHHRRDGWLKRQVALYDAFSKP